MLDTDTGVGINPCDTMSFIEPLRQGEQGEAISCHHKGSCLGLTIAQDLVQTMDGKMTVKVDRGDGALFQFSMLLKQGTRDVSTRNMNKSCNISIVDPVKSSQKTC